jgi:hypothetical protein
MTTPVPAGPTPKRGPGRPRSTETVDARRPRPKPRPKTLKNVGLKASPEARKLAAAILEVLGGVRTTSAAAEVLACSLPRYYQLEARAVEGLLAACEPARRGPGHSPRQEEDALRKKCARLEREVGRQQALVRATHRAVGLPPAPAPAKTKTGKKRSRRPTARALVAAAVLSAPGATMPVVPPSSAEPKA